MAIKAARGATTIDNDCAEEITAATLELMAALINENSPQRIIYIIFSTTADISAYYPATAFRKNGEYDVPLFSTTEPSINGGLNKCIRVLMLIESDNEIKNIYLRNAKNLRSL